MEQSASGILRVGRFPLCLGIGLGLGVGLDSDWDLVIVKNSIHHLLRCVSYPFIFHTFANIDMPTYIGDSIY